MEFPHECQTCLDIFEDLHLALMPEKQLTEGVGRAGQVPRTGLSK